ncbi:MAG TPA: hypothetical protein VK936_08160 [Longimicrobiales bacterium]|nr:hypothetical protein [Longimicrobiales bacterium]
MRPVALRAFASLIPLVFFACGGDSTTGPPADVIPEPLAGRWAAEPACVPSGCGFILAPVSDPTNTFNATAVLGITTEITIARSGGFSLTSTGTVPASGTARVASPGILVVTSLGGAVDTIDYSISGTALSIHIRKAYTFPYVTSDGVPVPANAGGVFHRK